MTMIPEPSMAAPTPLAFKESQSKVSTRGKGLRRAELCQLKTGFRLEDGPGGNQQRMEHPEMSTASGGRPAEALFQRPTSPSTQLI
jgi:hypothetical protein